MLLEVMFRYLARIGIDTGLYECRACAAIVTHGGKAQHAGFHVRIAELERANAEP